MPSSGSPHAHAPRQPAAAAGQRPPCPHCHAPRPVRWGHVHHRPRYRCASCRRTFTHRTGTPLARLRYPERFAEMPRCLREGLTTRAAARRLGVHPTTAWRWRHRLLALLHGEGRPLLDRGPVQVTQVLVLCSRKGIRGSRTDRGQPHSAVALALRRVAEGVRVLLARSPSGAVRCAVWGRGRELADPAPWIRGLVRPGVSVVTERIWALLPRAPRGRRRGARADGLCHRRPGEPPLEAVARLSRVLVRWLARFRGVGERYLGHYLTWFVLAAGTGTVTAPAALSA